MEGISLNTELQTWWNIHIQDKIMCYFLKIISPGSWLELKLYDNFATKTLCNRSKNVELYVNYCSGYIFCIVRSSRTGRWMICIFKEHIFVACFASRLLRNEWKGNESRDLRKDLQGYFTVLTRKLCSCIICTYAKKMSRSVSICNDLCSMR